MTNTPQTKTGRVLIVDPAPFASDLIHAFTSNGHPRALDHYEFLNVTNGKELSRAISESQLPVRAVVISGLAHMDEGAFEHFSDLTPTAVRIGLKHKVEAGDLESGRLHYSVPLEFGNSNDVFRNVAGILAGLEQRPNLLVGDFYGGAEEFKRAIGKYSPQAVRALNFTKTDNPVRAREILDTQPIQYAIVGGRFAQSHTLPGATGPTVYEYLSTKIPRDRTLVVVRSQFNLKDFRDEIGQGLQIADISSGYKNTQYNAIIDFANRVAESHGQK